MKIKTINDVQNAKIFPDDRFKAIMQKTEQILKEHASDLKKRNLNIGDTPISPMNLDDDNIPILLTENVALAYKKLVELINEPTAALEYSFLLLGKEAKLGEEKCYLIDKFVDCTLYDGTLSNRQTKIDERKLNQVIDEARKKGYNFISLGHTHPNIPTEEREITIANFLSKDEKRKELIRDVGLNLSLQDLISYESLYQYFKNNPNIQTAQTIIMYNSEMVILGKQQNKLKRATTIIDLSTYEAIYVSSKEEIQKERENISK